MRVIPYVGYLAGPYRDKRGAHYVRENIEAARRVAVRLWQAGVPVITPHLNTALMDGSAPDEHFLEGDIEILVRCSFVVMLPGWERSRGATEERVKATEWGLPVFYADGLCSEDQTEDEIRTAILEQVQVRTHR